MSISDDFAKLAKDQAREIYDGESATKYLRQSLGYLGVEPPWAEKTGGWNW